ncbi:MAG: ATP-grasp domain-containing protein [Bacteroidales bacterium]|nr:ATP-grasp domain-containing protein [Bacteroidales bacterium]
MKRNILVFPCGSEIGLDIYSSVRYSTYFRLIGASSIDDHGKFVYEDYISGVPYVTDPYFIPTMARIVKERQIDAIYPTMDLVITVLKEHEAEFGCRVISSSLETTKICLSKELTYTKLQGVVRVPRIYCPSNIPQEAFPVFAKPNIGYGANGTMKLRTQEEVDTFIKDKDDLLILEYLPGEEFTVDCFTDKDGQLLYSAARKRNRVRDGISVNTFFAENQDAFREMAQKINEQIKFRGAWFYQVKRDKDEQLCLLEIASRLGGSSLLSRAVGVNFALLSLFDAFDYKVTVSKNDYHVELDRALENRYKTNLQFDTVYCDYDDCLILDKNKVNVELVRFLYQCVNQGKKLVLLSKHEGDLKEELQAFRLDNLFDEVIHIDKESDKVGYIHSEKALFIDDSNAERVNVKSKLNLPVFSPEMVDVLME